MSYPATVFWKFCLLTVHVSLLAMGLMVVNGFEGVSSDGCNTGTSVPDDMYIWSLRAYKSGRPRVPVCYNCCLTLSQQLKLRVQLICNNCISSVACEFQV